MMWDLQSAMTGAGGAHYKDVWFCSSAREERPKPDKGKKVGRHPHCVICMKSKQGGVDAELSPGCPPLSLPSKLLIHVIQ